MDPTSQLTLAVELVDDAQFDNFYCSAANQQLVDTLKRNSSSEQTIFIAGAPGSGKSHLLHALCSNAGTRNASSICISLKDAKQLRPEMIDEISELALVCIDDFELLQSLDEWETPLFNLFNRMREANSQLVIAANIAPAGLLISLKDLQSRLQSMLIFNLSPLDDEEKKKALQLRAKKRGFDLTDAVVDYILTRAGRDFRELMSVLDSLDNMSLRKQRKLSIPLVKETLGW